MRRLVFGGAVLIGLACQGMAAQRPKSTPVFGTYRCAEPAGLSGCPTGDRVRSDGKLDPYVGELWVGGSPLTFQLASGRFLAVHPGEPDAGSAMCSPCLAVPLYNQVMWATAAQLHLVVLDDNGNELPGGFDAMPVGAKRFARGKINVWDPADDQALWVYRFNSAEYPGSSNLIVTRTSTEWIVQTQTGTEPSADRARLIYTRLRGKGFLNDEGLFSMPFELRVRK